MTITRPLGTDAFGITYTHTWDSALKKNIIHESMDAQAIVDENAELQKTDGMNAARDRKLIARIPMVLVHKWLLEDGVFLPRLSNKERRAYLRRKVRDPDFRKVLASGGAGVSGRTYFSRPAQRPKLILPGAV